MIIRKPTKIELKPEDDFYEYEDYKRKQLDQQKFLNPISSQLLKQDKEFYYSPEEQKQLVLEQTNALKHQFQQQYQSPNIDSFFSIGANQRQQQAMSSSAYKDIGNQQQQQAQFMQQQQLQQQQQQQQQGSPDQAQMNQLLNILLSQLSQSSAGPQQQQPQQQQQQQ